ncbi:MAG: hypothetical protein MUQ10_11110 [Anaerolineae bacterium]|nr:hypothetical protein [Anaerolineae bacterium]
MGPDTRAILCNRSLLQARNSHFARMEALFAGETPASAFGLKGMVGKATANPYSEPELWVEQALDDLAAQADTLRDEFVFRPLVIEFGPYGVHFIDSLFGAHVFDLDGTANWQARPLDRPVGSLQPPDLETHPTWRLARRVAMAFLEARVSLPLFGLPTIASPLNIAVNLYGQEIFVAMLADPEAAHRDLRVISDLLCTLHRWYREQIPFEQLQPVIAWERTQPPGFGQLCGCTTQLLSRGMYTEFIAPLDDELLSVYPNGGMIHLCGSHEQHISTWRQMGSLRAVQLNDRAAEDLPLYFDGLRDDQIMYVNPFERMPVERIMDITGGRRVVIPTDTELSTTVQQDRS